MKPSHIDMQIRNHSARKTDRERAREDFGLKLYGPKGTKMYQIFAIGLYQTKGNFTLLTDCAILSESRLHEHQNKYFGQV